MSEPQQPGQPDFQSLSDLASKSFSQLKPLEEPEAEAGGAGVTLLRESGRDKPGLKQPLAIALGPGPEVVVLDRPEPDRYRLSAFTPDGEATGWTLNLPRGAGDGKLLEPVAMAVDADQTFYFADAQDCCVKKFARDGKYLDSLRSSGPGGKVFQEPSDVAVDEQGNVLVADVNNSRVVLVGPDGELVWVLEKFRAAAGDDEFYEPCSACFGPSGGVYVVDRNQDRVLGFDGARRLIADWAGDAFMTPAVVRVAPDGRGVCVADRNLQRVQRLDDKGQCRASALFPAPHDGATLSAGGPFAVGSKGRVYLLDAVRESLLILALAEN